MMKRNRNVILSNSMKQKWQQQGKIESLILKLPKVLLLLLLLLLLLSLNAKWLCCFVNCKGVLL